MSGLSPLLIGSNTKNILNSFFNVFACEMLPKCQVSVQTAIQYSAIQAAIEVLEFVNFFFIFLIFSKFFLVSKIPKTIPAELCS